MNVRAKLFDETSSSVKYSPKNLALHQQFWVLNQPSMNQVMLNLPDQCVDEIDRIVDQLPSCGEKGLPNSVSAGLAEKTPQCIELAQEVQDRLQNGCGVVIVDRFPVKRYSDQQNRLISGFFASLKDPLMDQDFQGTQLYDVVNKPPKKSGTIRRSKTNLFQDYHTDGGWIDPPARTVGLFCIRNAQQGGHSRVTSLLAAYGNLLEQHPEALEVLMKGHPWDRQSEHAEGDVPYAMNPIFSVTQEGFLGRYYEDYVRKGYRYKGEEIDQQTDHALDLLARILDNQPRLRFMMEAGQFQLANNYTVVHAREAFEDDNSQTAGRHLVRIWHR